MPMSPLPRIAAFIGILAISVAATGLAGCSDATAAIEPATGSESTPASPSGVQASKGAAAVTDTRRLSSSGHDITRLSDDTIAELASVLTEEEYRVTQRSGTEPAHCGNLLDNKKEGFYSCVVCGLPLFASHTKFKSGTGWPSFYQPFDADHVGEKRDTTHGMVRVEIHCERCTAHLGHVFEDGPRPTGLRYCLNSASLDFVEAGDLIPARSLPVVETAYFAAGCFWGVEHYFAKGDGVIDAVSGYMQGKTDNPTYKDVCYTDSGHAEAVKVVFDPAKISYETLLEAFFLMHDPTQKDRQGPDVGSQYRSGIYVTSDAQLKAARDFKAKLDLSGVFRKPIATEIEPAEKFWSAEDYHQDYIVKTGRACHVRNPWPVIAERAAKRSKAEEATAGG